MPVATRLVIDTNALVSRLLIPESTPGHAVRKAIDEGLVLISEETIRELADVLARPKFDRYVTVRERQEFIRLLGRVAELVPIVRPVKACRDPRDDKFLTLAVNGEAQLIVSGDGDLLDLNPFHGVNIMSPATYLAAGC
ncbi:MAG: putative toxin-antitoxin system toxin component, PIN family [Nitrosospira sp.]|nr:putative toxin-antitoxin system toxin component, PIN family [Nitrosospira sp.]